MSAKIDLKFLDSKLNHRYIQVSKSKNFKDEDSIRLEVGNGGNFQRVFLDKSTAIKFAKTLRTEINKIQD